MTQTAAETSDTVDTAWAAQQADDDAAVSELFEGEAGLESYGSSVIRQIVIVVVAALAAAAAFTLIVSMFAGLSDLLVPFGGLGVMFGVLYVDSAF